MSTCAKRVDAKRGGGSQGGVSPRIPKSSREKLRELAAVPPVRPSVVSNLEQTAFKRFFMVAVVAGAGAAAPTLRG